MKNDSCFNGMQEVDTELAIKAAMKCICFIERNRNKIFYRKIQYNLDNPVEMKWWYDGYNFCGHWFKSYILIKTREEIIADLIKPHWYNYKFLDFMCNEYNNCLSIMNLQHNDKQFITPQQGLIIKNYKNGEYDEL